MHKEILGIIYLKNPMKEEFDLFRNEVGELRVFSGMDDNFYAFAASDATHLEFEQKLGIAHKIGTNLGITTGNKLHPSLGMMPHLSTLKEKLSIELYEKNITALKEFLDWISINFDVDISIAN